MKNNYLYIFLTLTLIFSCTKEENAPINNQVFTDGYFVVCEGNFTEGNGSISFISNDGEVQNDIFNNTNGFPLGDVVQSMTLANGKAYIVVNNSSKVEVVSDDSLKYIKTITGVGSPRYLTQVSSDKAYLSDWNTNSVHIIDLVADTVVGSITVGNGPESITVANEKAYVCNIGGWGSDNTISVIDIQTDQVVSTIEVNDKPNSALVDFEGNLWVLCKGKTSYNSTWSAIDSVSSTAGALIKIDPNTDEIELKIDFPKFEGPNSLVINEMGNKVYFLKGGVYLTNTSSAVYAHNTSQTEFNSIPMIDKNFYGISCDGKNLYCADASFTSASTVHKYNEYGTRISSNEVGVGASRFVFR